MILRPFHQPACPESVRGGRYDPPGSALAAGDRDGTWGFREEAAAEVVEK